eukprot:m.359604 g.359604  ORF g.359604 m.359604 type:complete len:90 (-) comp18646_c0_seq1:36-305(-)
MPGIFTRDNSVMNGQCATVESDQPPTPPEITSSLCLVHSPIRFTELTTSKRWTTPKRSACPFACVTDGDVGANQGNGLIGWLTVDTIRK